MMYVEWVVFILFPGGVVMCCVGGHFVKSPSKHLITCSAARFLFSLGLLLHPPLLITCYSQVIRWISGRSQTRCGGYFEDGDETAKVTWNQCRKQSTWNAARTLSSCGRTKNDPKPKEIRS
ncbi:hypothetical protein BC830DRAFT_820468 [Chytriomyces sp. MP71]|nr:hypothetical protein BC830DRAFT_820468 [Chytriomyces sp. MP71]